MLTSLILTTVLLPFIVSFVVQLSLQKVTSNSDGLYNILGLGLGSTLSYLMILGLPGLPPAGLNQSFFYQFIFVTVSGLIFSLLKNNIQKYSFVLLTFIFLAYSTINNFYAGLGLNKSLIFSFIICILGLLYTFIINKVHEKISNFIIPSVLSLITIFSSFILFMSSSALLGQLTGVMASVFIAGFFVFIIHKKYTFANSLFFFQTSFLLIMWFLGYYLLDISAFIIIPLLISPLSLLINFSTKIQSFKKLNIFFLNILLTLIPLIISFIQTAKIFFSRESIY